MARIMLCSRERGLLYFEHVEQFTVAFLCMNLQRRCCLPSPSPSPSPPFPRASEASVEKENQPTTVSYFCTACPPLRLGEGPILVSINVANVKGGPERTGSAAAASSSLHSPPFLFVGLLCFDHFSATGLESALPDPATRVL